MNKYRVFEAESVGEQPVELGHEGLEVLTGEESARLLRTHRLGRLVFAYESWPVVIPVNYIYEDPTVVIRTDLGAKLTATPFHAAAFEIDDADPSGAWGWSVLAQGPAFDITNACDAHSEHLRTLPVTPWPPGIRDHWLAVSAVRLTGRRFGQVPELDEVTVGARLENHEQR